MPIALITFEFDPLLHLPDRVIRWETIAIGAAVFLAILIAGLLAGRIPTADQQGRASERGKHLRRDDLVFVILGVVPGAILGGRLAYLALNFDYYDVHRDAILDPASGGLSLSAAVVFGALSGALVARLFDTPIGRWFHLAVVPTLLVLGLGKAAMILGGTGQGVRWSGEWATRYLGSGPWGSLGPQIPSYPAQAFEAVGVAIVLVVVAGLWLLGAFRSRDGRAFAIALGGWAVMRLVVASTWRDPLVWGPFNAEQLIDVAIVALASIAFLFVIRRTARSPLAAPSAAPGTDLSWPDPEAHSQF